MDKEGSDYLSEAHENAGDDEHLVAGSRSQWGQQGENGSAQDAVAEELASPKQLRKSSARHLSDDIAPEEGA